MRLLGFPLTLCALLLLGAQAAAQPQRDALFLEAGGPGGAFTLSYERTFGRVTPRLGLGVTPASVQMPVLATVRVGEGRGRFEAGGGAVLAVTASEHEGVSPVWPAATLGYRLDFADAPLAFRAEFTPMWVIGDGVAPWFGLGIGVSFDRRHALR